MIQLWMFSIFRVDFNLIVEELSPGLSLVKDEVCRSFLTANHLNSSSSTILLDIANLKPVCPQAG